LLLCRHHLLGVGHLHLLHLLGLLLLQHGGHVRVALLTLASMHVLHLSHAHHAVGHAASALLLLLLLLLLLSRHLLSRLELLHLLLDCHLTAHLALLLDRLCGVSLCLHLNLLDLLGLEELEVAAVFRRRLCRETLLVGLECLLKLPLRFWIHRNSLLLLLRMRWYLTRHHLTLCLRLRLCCGRLHHSLLLRSLSLSHLSVLLLGSHVIRSRRAMVLPLLLKALHLSLHGFSNRCVVSLLVLIWVRRHVRLLRSSLLRLHRLLLADGSLPVRLGLSLLCLDLRHLGGRELRTIAIDHSVLHGGLLSSVLLKRSSPLHLCHLLGVHRPVDTVWHICRHARHHIGRHHLWSSSVWTGVGDRLCRCSLSNDRSGVSLSRCAVRYLGRPVATLLLLAWTSSHECTWMAVLHSRAWPW
jgi:hypothetical protein